MSAGKFDGLSHNELYAMVADASPSQLTEMGSALSEASMELNAISDLLRHHVERVRWQGEGGDAFREWGGEMVKQAAKLADYTVFAGSYIGQAGDGLSEVKSAMPKPDPTAECLTDPEKEQARLKVTESHRQEAINLMNKLDSYYRVAHEGLAGLEEPTFRPIPLVRSGFDEWERPYRAAEVSGGTGSGGGGAYASPASTSVGAAGDAYAAGSQQQNGAVGGPAGAENRPDGAQPHISPAVGGIEGTAIDSTGVVTPPSDTGMRPGNVAVPDTPKHIGGVGPVAPIAPSGPLPGMPSTGVSRTVAGLSGSPSVGGSSKGGLSVPRYGSVPRTGASDGIVGGTPTRPGGDLGGQRLPRGTVVGEERGAVNRGPVGMSGPVGTAGGSAPSPLRFGTGRRLAMEPGGVVAGPHPNGQLPSAGAKLPRGTVVGAEHDSHGGAAAHFTPGGSGLVRENPTPGPLPSGATGGSGGRRRAVSRPDYVTEDEETWMGGRRDTVPPVIQ